MLVTALEDGSEDVRAAAIVALGDRKAVIGADRILSIACSEQEDPLVQREAVFYFELLSDADRVYEIFEFAPDADVRAEALAALERLDYADLRVAYEEARHDESRGIRRSAKRSLAALDRVGQQDSDAEG